MLPLWLLPGPLVISANSSLQEVAALAIPADLSMLVLEVRLPHPLQVGIKSALSSLTPHVNTETVADNPTMLPRGPVHRVHMPPLAPAIIRSLLEIEKMADV